ncbi:hypothetical protein [Actinokineospora bangkokensis]|uniref:Lipoprotein n=1 Tax=Actinokineospora bangkokensis TaxID=1193682 RepID=A0A1Q9LFR8_9PSEU|nr:hypothetical protein [Actinokineospora bangkokensis]OLR90881.1 hypothetical protein BJP25_30450 [Actinokineospora bangkokensis]
MRKRAASVLAGLLLAAGCAEAKQVEPPADFTDAVRALLDGATFGARTCGVVFDRDPDANVYAWADATVPAASLDALRAKAISAGWQPVRTDRYALALSGRDSRRLAATVQGDRAEVRVESVRCSAVPTDKLPDEAFHEIELTGAQRAALDPVFPATLALARGFGAAAGAQLDPAVFPAAAAQPPASWLALCQDGPAFGVRLTASVSQELPASTDVEAVHAALAATPGAGWSVDPQLTGQRSWVTATRDRVKVSTFLDKRAGHPVEFELRVEAPGCLPPA